MLNPDKTLDIQGIAGRRARALAMQTLEPMRPGQVLKLITSEKNATSVIADLCREEGYVLLEEVMDGAQYSFFIRR